MKQNTTYTRNTKETTEKPVLANKTKHALVWYTSYDLRPGNGADPTLTALKPTWGIYLINATVFGAHQLW